MVSEIEKQKHEWRKNMKRYAVVCKIRKIENSNSKINNTVSWIEFKMSDIHYCNGIK